MSILTLTPSQKYFQELFMLLECLHTDNGQDKDAIEGGIDNLNARVEYESVPNKMASWTIQEWESNPEENNPYEENSSAAC